MNIYKFHSKPEQLDHYSDASEKLPQLAWEKYKSNPNELRKRETLWADEAECSFWYAHNVITNPFPAGEAAIATDAKHSYWYSRYIIKKPWPDTKIGKKAEAAIASEAEYSHYYARYLLERPWPAGEAAIATDAQNSCFYALRVLKKPWPDTEIGKKAEDSIAGSAQYSLLYAKEFNLKLVDGEFVPK